MTSMLSRSVRPPGIPGDDDPGVSNDYRLPEGASFTGYYWLKNESTLAHTYRVVCLVDYKQTSFSLQEAADVSHDIRLAPHEDGWWTLKIPGLSRGRHDVILLLVWEPGASRSQGYGLGVSASRVTVTVGDVAPLSGQLPLAGDWGSVPSLSINTSASAEATPDALIPRAGEDAVFGHLVAPAGTRWEVVAFLDALQVPLSAESPSLVLAAESGSATRRILVPSALRDLRAGQLFAVAFPEPGRPLSGDEPQVFFGTIDSNRLQLAR
ncbi:MAG TPA: hypothetical protein VIL17_07245 [Coriobacteriia bacterium]